MFFYFGNNYSARAEGGVWQEVECEGCHQRYYYRLERSAVGSAHSPLMLNNSGAAKAADRVARERLKRRLTRGCDAVPCPHCGWYQRGMYAVYAKHFFGWMSYASFALFLVGVMLLIVSFAFSAGKNVDPVTSERNALWAFVAALVCMVGCVTVRLARRVRRSMVNPNDLVPENERIRLGRKMALTESQFQEIAAISSSIGNP